MRNFTVGDIAKLFNNTKSAVRFYEDKGLICPERNDSGYRIYTLKDFFQLLYLKKYGNMGISIDDVRDNITETNQSSLEDLVAYLKEKEKENIDEVSRLLKKNKIIKEKYEVFTKYIENNNFYEIVEAGDKYFVSEEFLQNMNVSEMDIIRRWLLDLLYVQIVSFYEIENGEVKRTSSFIGISGETALNRNIPIPKEALHIPKSKYYHTIISKEGKSFQIDHGDSIKEYIKVISNMGYKLNGSPRVSIAFSHINQEKEIKYYDVLIPIC